MDHPIQFRRPDHVLINKIQGIGKIVCNQLKLQIIEKQQLGKYLDLGKEQNKLYIMKVTIHQLFPDVCELSRRAQEKDRGAWKLKDEIS